MAVQPALSRSQVAVYAALGVVLVLLGARAIRGEPATGSEPGAQGDRSQPGVVAREPVGSGAGPGELLVHVAGAVRRPGVYRFPAGARVGDAIERAGGEAGRADPDAINLAAPLGDGQRVVVPARTGPAHGSAAGGPAAAASSGPDPGEPISLATATAAELESIAGIGPVTAANILAFREERGGIGSIDELDQVPGIGPATLAALAERLQP